MIDQRLIKNPDADDIIAKRAIDINYVTGDLTSSTYSYTSRVQTDYQDQRVVIYNTSGSANEPGYVYYTPLYNERLSYEKWKVQINKSFKELGNL